MRKQAAVLKDVADAAAKLDKVPFGGRMAFDNDAAAGRHYQAVNELQRGRFAAAGFAKKDEYLAANDRKVQAVEYPRARYLVAYVLKVNYIVRFVRHFQSLRILTHTSGLQRSAICGENLYR